MTAKTIGDAVRKIAVIADARFADERLSLADVAENAVIRFFAPGKRDEGWLGCAAGNGDDGYQVSGRQKFDRISWVVIPSSVLTKRDQDLLSHSS